MKNDIDKMLKYLSELTKEEAEFAQHVVTWPDEYKFAFLTAKRIFEGDIDDDEEDTIK